MANFTDFTVLVSNFVPNVPEFVVGRAGQQCAQDFLGRTTLLTTTISLTTIVDEHNYKLSTNVSDTFINHILSVTNANGKAVDYTERGDQITLLNAPQQVETLTIEAALNLTVDALEIPDDLYHRYSMVFRYGTIAILKSQESTKWSDPQGYVGYMQKYEQEINQVKILDHTFNNSMLIELPTRLENYHG